MDEVGGPDFFLQYVYLLYFSRCHRELYKSGNVLDGCQTLDKEHLDNLGYLFRLHPCVAYPGEKICLVRHEQRFAAEEVTTGFFRQLEHASFPLVLNDSVKIGSKEDFGFT